MPIYDSEIFQLSKSGSTKTQPENTPHKRAHSRVLVICVLLVIIAGWLALDQLTKAYFDAQQPGAILGGPYAGLIQFTLVHNTGMAWGLFGNSTFVLGIMSTIVCAAFLIFGCIAGPKLNWAEIIGLGLVVAGGIGNAIDRFTLGYVVDFIQTAFMNFPVFNVADIGVTCGFVLFIIGLFVHSVKSSSTETSASDADPSGDE